MPWGSALAIYILFWVVTLFAVLPFGVRTSEEAGQDRVAGAADSSPHEPLILRKFAWTTLVSAVLFGLFYLAYSSGWIALRP